MERERERGKEIKKGIKVSSTFPLTVWIWLKIHVVGRGYMFELKHYGGNSKMGNSWGGFTVVYPYIFPIEKKRSGAGKSIEAGAGVPISYPIGFQGRGEAKLSSWV